MSAQHLSKGFFPLVFLFVIIGCTKVKNTDIGVDLLPAIDNVTTFDTTLSVAVETAFIPDSLMPRVTRDLYGAVGDFVLGHLSNEPVFGATTASAYYELKPTEYPFNFENKPDSLYLDSVVLGLKWRNTFGDTNGIQGIDVYKVSEFIRPDTSYPLSASVSYGELLGTSKFAPSILNDSINLGTYKSKDQLRITITPSFGKALLAFDSALTTSPLKSDSLFRDYFKGFALIPQKLNSSNALMTFDMDDTATYVRMYYQYIKNGDRDTTYKTFTFKNLKPGGAINQITRNYTNTELSRFITKKESDSLVYIHSTPGTYAKISIPSLDVFKKIKGNVIVHLAELSMQEVLTTARRTDLFVTPTYLYVEGIDSASKSYVPFTADGFPAGTFDPTVFGGKKKSGIDPQNKEITTYSMNMTRYVQGIITRNDKNYPLRLQAPYVVTYPALVTAFYLNPMCRGGVVLGGGSHPTQRMKLRLVYSKL
ncbi:MAG: DUF4270 family protein [Chitinophagaceae bacterium]